MKKLCCILTLIVLLLNSSAMILISNAVDAVEQAINAEDSKHKAVAEVNLEKYVNYAEGEEQGTLVQLGVSAGIEKEEEENCNVKNLTLTLETPKLNEQYPVEVKVLGLDNSQYTYNNKTGKVEIKFENKETVQYTDKTSYSISLIYNKDVYIDNNELRYISTKVSVEYNLEEKIDNKTTQTEKLTAWQSREVPVTENIGAVVTADTDSEDVYNGYINNNIKNNTTYQTEYKETSKVEISYRKLAKEIVLNETNKLIKDDVEIENEDGLIYKEITFNKSNLLDMLDENGYIEVLNENDEVIKKIDSIKDKKEEEIKISFEQNVKQLKLKIYNISKEGYITINKLKVITENLKQNIDTIKTNIELNKNIQENVINIKEATTKIELTLDNITLKNNVQNNVIITASLKTDSAECKLFNSPVLEIKLPEEVEKILLWDAETVFDEKINIANTEIIEDETGNKIIRLILIGEQTEYKNNAQKGIDVLISASIILKQNIETKNSEIKLTSRQKDEITETNTNITLVGELSQTPVEEEKFDTIQTIDGLKVETAAVVGDTVLSNGDTVYEKQIIKYKVKLTNTTNNIIENVKVIGNIADETTFVELKTGNYRDAIYEYIPNNELKQKELIFGNIKPNESKEYYYEVQINDLNSDVEKILKSVIDIYSNETKIYQYVLTNSIKSAEMRVFLKSYIGRSEKNAWDYDLDIENLTSKVLKDVVVTVDIPKEFTVKEVMIGSNYVGEIKGNQLTVKIDELLVNETKTVEINVKANNVTENDDCSYSIPMVGVVSAKGTNTYKSNQNIVSGNIEGVTIKQTSDKSGERLQLGEEVTYKFEIKNIGYQLPEFGNYTTINLKDYLPEELDITSIKYENYQVKYTLGEKSTFESTTYQEILDESLEKIVQDYTVSSHNLDVDLILPVGETLTVVIKGNAKTVYESTEISNYAIVTGEYIATKQSNIIKNTILRYDYDVTGEVNNNSNGNENNPGNTGNNNGNENSNTPSININDKFSITGLAWLDENENGRRDQEEKTLSNIIVKLLKENSNEILAETKTDSNGKYLFKDLSTGKYVIVFEYDNKEYYVTTYAQEGISSEYNSDAIVKETTLENMIQKYGVTDTINLTSSKNNIDIGLIKNKEFDIKIDKYITKVTVQTGDKTKTYNYKDVKLAKIDVDGKKMSDTTVAVEYKIKVTNVGQLSGTINEVIDEIPNALDFHSELNKDWAKTGNGSASNTSLTNKELATGESVELTLVLTKKLAENTVGTVTNTAKIGITNNAKNVADENVGNDSSKAELIISIKTGATVYLGTVIAVLLGICVTIFIGLLVFKKGFRYKFMIVLVASISIASISTKYTTTNVSLALDIPGVVYIRQESHSAINGPWVDSDGREYDCTSPGNPMCEQWHKFTLDSISAESEKRITKIWNEEAISMAKNSTTIEYVGEINGRDVYGPFNVTVTVTGKNTSLSGVGFEVTAYNENGSSVGNNIVDRNGNGSSISSGNDFYISVPKDTNAISQVKVKASKSTIQHNEWERTVKANYSSNDYCGGYYGYSTQKIQNMKSKTTYIETGDDTKTITIEAEVVYTVHELPKTITLEKINNENSNIKFAGVQFVLKNDNKGYVKQDNIKHITYVQNEADATIFTTDSNGKITIKGLDTGSHTIKEIYNSNYGYDIDGDYITWVVNGNTSKGQSVTFNISSSQSLIGITAKNEQKYVRISGYVWEDISNTKNNETNNQYDLGEASKDKLVDGIKVTLYDTLNNKTYTTWTDSNGAYIFGSRSNNMQESSSVDGTYSVDNLLVRNLKYYYVEFEYNGMKYTSVVSNLKIENGSKAEEPDNTRIDFNNKYRVISGVSLKDKTTGNTAGAASTLNKNISYTGSLELYNSTINYIEGNSVNEYYAADKYHIQSNTNETGYNIKDSYVVNEPEIKNINLGIVRREQIDLSISEDIANVVVKVNGYTHTYEYGAREFEEGRFNVGIKFADEYSNRYTRTIYPSDIEWHKEDRDNHKLEVYVTYKITIKNQSTTLYARVNELANYYDKEYTITEVRGASNYNRDRIDAGNGYIRTTLSGINPIEAERSQDVYITYQVSDEAVLGLLNAKRTLDNMTEITSYSTFYGANTVNGSERGTLGTVYASIDLDSAPGNSELEVNALNRLVRTTYEDDTDLAPSLILDAEVKKAMTGTVFEDSAIKESLAQEERYGDGIYQKGKENVVYNAKVDIIDLKTGEVADLYDKDSKTKATTYTDKQGNYTLVGIIPGEYIVKYTYGNNSYILDLDKKYTFNEDGTITYKAQNSLGQEIDKLAEAVDVRDYKSTIITSKVLEQALAVDGNGNITGKGNLNWHVDAAKETVDTGNRYSDAVDDLNIRAKIDEQPVNYKTVTKYLEDRNFSMEANTPQFNIGVEFTTIEDYTSNTSFAQEYQLDENGKIKYDEAGNPMPKDEFITADENMDFGIMERARQDIVIDKQIADISVILATGQVLISGDPRNPGVQMPYVKTGLDDFVPIEIDSELIQGATLKIKYEIILSNNSEKDYVYTNKSGKNYYFFGRKDGAEELMTDIELVADYMTNKLACTIDDKTNTAWNTSLTAQDLLEAGQISEDVYNEIKDGYIILTTTEFNDVKRKESKTLTLEVSKLLSTSEDMTYKNSVEILQLKSEVGRTIMNSVPGNYMPNEAPVEQDEDQVILVITPPTGIIDYVQYILFTVSMLVVLGVGIYMIKRRIIG